MSNQNETQESTEKVKTYTREDIKAYLAEIEERVIASDEACVHSVVALNQLLRMHNAEDVLDQELKDQMRDLWIKLKSMGMQLNDPPLLFGLPEDFYTEEKKSEENESVE